MGVYVHDCVVMTLRSRKKGATEEEWVQGTGNSHIHLFSSVSTTVCLSVYKCICHSHFPMNTHCSSYQSRHIQPVHCINDPNAGLIAFPVCKCQAPCKYKWHTCACCLECNVMCKWAALGWGLVKPQVVLRNWVSKHWMCVTCKLTELVADVLNIASLKEWKEWNRKQTQRFSLCK